MFILEEKLFQLKLTKVEKLVWNVRVAAKMMTTVNSVLCYCYTSLNVMRVVCNNIWTFIYTSHTCAAHMYRYLNAVRNIVMCWLPIRETKLDVPHFCQIANVARMTWGEQDAMLAYFAGNNRSKWMRDSLIAESVVLKSGRTQRADFKTFFDRRLSCFG